MENIEVPREIKDMLAAGVHWGHQKRWVHPNMLPYIFGVRSNVHIIDVDKTREKLAAARDYLKKIVQDDKIILFVGTKLPVRDLVRKAAEEAGMPHITQQWIGGTLTNWRTIKARIDYLKELEAKRGSEEWEKHTKHEKAEMEEEIAKLNAQWEGVKSMEKLPDAVLIVDMHDDALAVAEANKLGIPLIALADTNVDPKKAAYPVPANDDAVSSVAYIVGQLKSAIIEGKSIKGKKKKPAKKKTTKKK